jgi:hypothetical protein
MDRLPWLSAARMKRPSPESGRIKNRQLASLMNELLEAIRAFTDAVAERAAKDAQSHPFGPGCNDTNPVRVQDNTVHPFGGSHDGYDTATKKKHIRMSSESPLLMFPVAPIVDMHGLLPAPQHNGIKGVVVGSTSEQLSIQLEPVLGRFPSPNIECNRVAAHIQLARFTAGMSAQTRRELRDHEELCARLQWHLCLPIMFQKNCRECE